MKIAIIINSIRYKNHTEKAEIFKRVLGNKVNELLLIDMNSRLKDYEIFYQLRDYKPDLVITFDLAGFELRTELNDISLNILPCRMAHILFDKSYKYPELKSVLLNISHFVVVLNGEDINLFRQSCRGIRNVMAGSLSDENEINIWFELFCKEAWLS